MYAAGVPLGKELLEELAVARKVHPEVEEDGLAALLKVDLVAPDRGGAVKNSDLYHNPTPAGGESGALAAPRIALGWRLVLQNI